MFKLIILVLGLVIGFGGGVYWGVHHPDQASSLSAQEEEQFLRAQQSLAQQTKSTLDRLASKRNSTNVNIPGVSNLVDSNAPGASVDADLQDLQQKAQAQLNSVQSRLNQIASH